MSGNTAAKRLEKPNTKSWLYNGEIDFWKLIFSYMIVMFHGRLLSNDPSVAYFTSGQLAVEFFFIVSGYFMMQSADSASKRYDGIDGHSIWQENLDFIWRKIKAILPFHIFAFVINFSVWAYIYIVQDAPTTWEFFCKALESIWSLLLLYQSGVKYNHINDVLWYVSAMLFVMFVLYPIIRKFRKGFCTYGMPIIAFVLLGYISNTKGSLTGAHDYSIYLTEGVIRAFLDIIIGCLVYQIVQYISKKDFSKIASAALAGLEVVLYITVIAICNLNQKYDKAIYDAAMDFVCLLFLAAGAIIMFSKKSIISGLFSSQKLRVLSTFSTSLYFNHIWIRLVFVESKYDISYKKQLAVFVLLATVSAFLCMAFLKLIKKDENCKKSRRVMYAIAVAVLAGVLAASLIMLNAYATAKIF